MVSVLVSIQNQNRHPSRVLVVIGEESRKRPFSGHVRSYHEEGSPGRGPGTRLLRENGLPSEGAWVTPTERTPEGTTTVVQLQPEITFIVTYRCPRCDAALEARTRESHTWLRCPRCGRASLPPEHMRTPPPPVALDDDVLVIGSAPDDVAAPRAGRRHPGGTRRISLAAGILISLTMLMISFVDGNTVNVGIFGVVTLVLFAILGYTARRR